MSDCYLFNLDGKWKQKTPRSSSGFFVLLSKRKHDCFFNCTDGYFNVDVITHAPGTIPILNDDERSQAVQDSIKIIFEYEEKKRLPKPHGECIDNFPADVEKYIAGMGKYNYTFEACFETDCGLNPLFPGNQSCELQKLY